jgi:hypothetical protein
MGRTERRVLVLGSVVFLLSLSAAGSAAPSAALDGSTPPPRPLPASPAAFAESPAAFAQRAAGGSGDSPALKAEGSFRNAVELIVLALTCGVVVAFYSASSSRQGGKRVPTRSRR